MEGLCSVFGEAETQTIWKENQRTVYVVVFSLLNIHHTASYSGIHSTSCMQTETRKHANKYTCTHAYARTTNTHMHMDTQHTHIITYMYTYIHTTQARNHHYLCTFCNLRILAKFGMCQIPCL